MPELNHLNAQGEAWMVDVGGKAPTQRRAIAEGWLRLGPEARALVASGAGPKGEVLGVARLAGIMAAKRTSEWIPLCHPLALRHVAVTFSLEAEGLRCEVEVRCEGPTGVEMEALTAVGAALLTAIDMLKAIQRDLRIDGIRLIRKEGGQSGCWLA